MENFCDLRVRDDGMSILSLKEAYTKYGLTRTLDKFWGQIPSKYQIAYCLTLCSPIIHMVKDDESLSLLWATMRWLADEKEGVELRVRYITVMDNHPINHYRNNKVKHILYLSCLLYPDVFQIQSGVERILRGSGKTIDGGEHDRVFRSWMSIPTPDSIPERGGTGHYCKRCLGEIGVSE